MAAIGIIKGKTGEIVGNMNCRKVFELWLWLRKERKIVN